MLKDSLQDLFALLPKKKKEKNIGVLTEKC